MEAPPRKVPYDDDELIIRERELGFTMRYYLMNETRSTGLSKGAEH